MGQRLRHEERLHRGTHPLHGLQGRKAASLAEDVQTPRCVFRAVAPPVQRAPQHSAPQYGEHVPQEAVHGHPEQRALRLLLQRAPVRNIAIQPVVGQLLKLPWILYARF